MVKLKPIFLLLGSLFHQVMPFCLEITDEPRTSSATAEQLELTSSEYMILKTVVGQFSEHEGNA